MTSSVQKNGNTMPPETSQRMIRYDSVAMSLHWTIALLMIFMVLFGENLMDRHQTGTYYASIHASTGITILLLSLFRLFWRWRNPPPPLPKSMKPWEIMLSKVTHIFFYAMMIGLPLSGWLAFSGLVVKHPNFIGTSYFGLINVIQIPAAASIPFDAIHNLGGNLMIALIALHVLAALKHQFIDKDGVLKRMSP
jgi:cytochrome b561